MTDRALRVGAAAELRLVAGSVALLPNGNIALHETGA